jgi:hypothetical protein
MGKVFLVKMLTIKKQSSIIIFELQFDKKGELKYES